MIVTCVHVRNNDQSRDRVNVKKENDEWHNSDKALGCLPKTLVQNSEDKLNSPKRQLVRVHVKKGSAAYMQ